MSASASSFLLPDTEPTWRFWKSLSASKADTLASAAECRESSRPLVVGLPATGCRTIGLILPTVDGGLLPAMVESQLERRGIHLEKAPTVNFAWHLLSQTQGLSFVSVDVLAHPFPETLALSHAANYTAALRLATLPVGQLCLVEEQGLLVLVANNQGQLWHSHIVGFAEMPEAEVAREVEFARLSLEAQEGFGVIRGLTLVGEKPSSMAGVLKKHLSLPVETASTLVPNKGIKLAGFSKLLPAAVHQAKASQERRRRLVSVLALTVVLYILLAAFGWWNLNNLKKDAADLEDKVSLTRGPAELVKTASERWRALEPAVDKQRYPMLQLSHLSSIMPPSGVVIKRFTAKPAEIELRGDARDLQTAAQLLEDLKKHPKLNRFHWEMPTPDMRNKVASFRITGKLEGDS